MATWCAQMFVLVNEGSPLQRKYLESAICGQNLSEISYGSVVLWHAIGPKLVDDSCPQNTYFDFSVVPAARVERGQCVRALHQSGRGARPAGYHRPLCVPISILASFHISRFEALRKSRVVRISTHDNFMARATSLRKTLSSTVLRQEPVRDPLAKHEAHHFVSVISISTLHVL